MTGSRDNFSSFKSTLQAGQVKSKVLRSSKLKQPKERDSKLMPSLSLQTALIKQHTVEQRTLNKVMKLLLELIKIKKVSQDLVFSLLERQGIEVLFKIMNKPGDDSF